MTYAPTYAELVADVQRYVEEDSEEFVAALPGIIARAHAKVQRDLGLSIFRTVVANHVTAGSAVYVRDPAWLKVLSVRFPAAGTFAERRTRDYVRHYGGRGVPRYWAEDSETVLDLAPTPLNNDTVEIEVLTRSETLSPDVATTWLARNCGDLVLLAALVGAESFLIAPERTAEFQALYAEALLSAKAELRGLDRPEYAPIKRTPQKPSIAEAA